MFATYLELGINHILDINAYDHLLFIIVLTAPFTIQKWKQVIIMATAFTLGHSVTLILSSMDLIKFSSNIIEFLIPFTILATGIYNIYSRKRSPKRGLMLSYNMAAFFGLIHGMGFSNFLRASLLPGEEGSFFTQLLAFNVGIEISQIIIIFMILLSFLFLDKIFDLKHKMWCLILSTIGILFSVYLMIETWPL